MSKISKMLIQRLLINLTACLFFSPGLTWGGNFLAFDIGYQQGDFASDVTERLSIAYVSAGRMEKRYDFSVSLPYLYYSATDSVTSFSQSGLGDVFLRGGVRLYATETGFSFYSALGIKFPVADESRGLGSGEFDAGLYLNLKKQWRNYYAMLYAGYINYGDPPGVAFENVPAYGLTVSKLFGSSHVYFSLQGNKAGVSGNPDPISLAGGLYFMLNTKLVLRAQASFGLSSGSPDYGFTGGIVTWL